MTTISILSVPDGDGGCLYQAVAGDRQAAGSTPGSALDAIAPQLAAGSGGALVVVHSNVPDQFFSADQKSRLEELMNQWRNARDAGQSLPADATQELEQLVQLELRAAGQRANAMAQELNQ